MSTRDPRGADARTSPRIDLRLSAEVTFDGKHYTALTRNLSVGGVCLEGPIPVAEGGELAIGLFLVYDDVEDSTRPPLEMKGRVAWATPGEEGEPTILGVRFESVSPAQLTALTGYLGLVEH